MGFENPNFEKDPEKMTFGERSKAFLQRAEREVNEIFHSLGVGAFETAILIGAVKTFLAYSNTPELADAIPDSAFMYGTAVFGAFSHGLKKWTGEGAIKK